MATLIVRNVAPELVQQLRYKAVEHGRSAEEEHRAILRQALEEKQANVPDFKAMLTSIPAGDEDVFARDHSLGRKIDL